MPVGTISVDSEKTFSTILLMSSGPRLRYGSTEQDVAADGQRKWSVSAAVSFIPEHGMPAQSDVISVTVNAGTDPAAGIAPGTPVELINLRVGISAPERRQNDRGDRIVGGKPYWMATGLRPAHAARQPGKVDAA